jgi:hypothetical protein
MARATPIKPKPAHANSNKMNPARWSTIATTPSIKEPTMFSIKYPA